MTSGAPADLDALFRARERLWRAQFALATTSPRSSARRLLSRRAGFALAAALAVLLALVLVEPLLPVIVLFLAASALALFVGLQRVIGGVSAAVARGRHRPQAFLIDTPPRYSVLVPLRDEIDLVPSLVSSLWALDYPVDRIEVLLLVDGVDLRTIHAAETAIGTDARFRVVRVPAGDHRSQGVALNYALAEATGEYLAVVGARHRLRRTHLLEAADLFSSSSPHLATVVAQLHGLRGERGLTAAWDGLSRTEPLPRSLLVDGVVHHRRDEVVAAGAWDPFNCEPALDLRLRLRRAGREEAELATSAAYLPRADPLDIIGRRATASAGAMQSWIVDRRERVRSDGASHLAALPIGAHLPLAILRPALVSISLLLVARPHAATGFVEAFPRLAVVPAFAVAGSALVAYVATVVRGLARDPQHALAAAMRPLWSLLDACGAIKGAVMLARGSRSEPQPHLGNATVDAGRPVPTAVVGR